MGIDYLGGLKNIVIMGGSYAGLRAARVLAEQLVDRDDYRIIVIDKNSHMNLIPYTRTFREGEHRHLIVQATILSMTANSVTVSYASPPSGNSSDPSAAILEEFRQHTIPFEFAVYALGASLPQPINVWEPFDKPVPKYSEQAEQEQKIISDQFDGSKCSSVAWLKTAQRRVQNTESVIVVGGGALGIQIASDIAAVYPQKRVTLMHSRERFMPIYDPQMHDLVMGFLSKLNVSVVMNSRLSWDSMQEDIHDEEGRRILKTVSGDEYRADTVFLCTGCKGNVAILSQGLGEDCINPANGLVKVLRTLQVDKPQAEASQEGEEHEERPKKSQFPHIFAIGDSADAFGAIKAGHTAYYQGEVAAMNIAKLITNGQGAALDQYTPGPPAIKISVGLKHYVTQAQGLVYSGDDGRDDLGVAVMWKMFGHDIQEQADFDL